MDNRNQARPLALAARAVLLLALFIAFRARTFTYCIGYEDQAHGRAVESAQSCSADEKQMERTDWQRQGLRSKLKLAGSAVARAFGVN